MGSTSSGVWGGLDVRNLSPEGLMYEMCNLTMLVDQSLQLVCFGGNFMDCFLIAYSLLTEMGPVTWV